jgi:hypothetical protein
MKRLSLSAAKLVLVGSFHFPSLRQLSLNSAKLSEPDFRALLDPVVSPALDVLSISDLMSPTGKKPFPKLPSALASRFCLVVTFVDEDEPYQPHIPHSRILLDVHSIEENRSKLAIAGGGFSGNLRLRFPPNHTFDPSRHGYHESRTLSADADFRLLVEHLYTTPHMRQLLPSLHLPLSLHPASAVDLALADLRDELLELCAREGVRVFWYDAVSATQGWFVTETFVEYARKRKEQERTAREEEVQS